MLNIPISSIEEGIKLGSDLFGLDLTGKFPRGNFKKFQRAVYPIMFAQAKTVGFATSGIWFGSVTLVFPSGEFIALFNADLAAIGCTKPTGCGGDAATGRSKLRQYVTDQGYRHDIYNCPDGVDVGSVNDMMQHCSFTPVNSGSTKSMSAETARALAELAQAGTPVPPGGVKPIGGGGGGSGGNFGGGDTQTAGLGSSLIVVGVGAAAALGFAFFRR